MGEFFKGWRRKVGCVTLVMALVFTAAWVRSRVAEDDLSFVYPDLLSRDGGIEESVVILFMSANNGIVDTSESRQIILWRIHYGEVAVPLTLLSAYLILWKPRKREKTYSPD